MKVVKIFNLFWTKIELTRFSIAEKKTNPLNPVLNPLKQNTRRATRRTLTTSPNRQCQSDPSIFTSLQANSKMDHRPSSPGRRAQLNEKTKVCNWIFESFKSNLSFFFSRLSRSSTGKRKLIYSCHELHPTNQWGQGYKTF